MFANSGELALEVLTAMLGDFNVDGAAVGRSAPRNPRTSGAGAPVFERAHDRRLEDTSRGAPARHISHARKPGPWTGEEAPVEDHEAGPSSRGASAEAWDG